MMISRFIPVMVLGAALAVSGCVGTSEVSRGFGFDSPVPIENVAVQNWNVTAFEVNVPRTLTSSEANTIKPRADLVWREDPAGDRHAQIDALMTAALAPGFAAVDGDTPVIVTLDVTRFHAQTQRVRYSNLRSAHEIEFVMTVRHAETGEILSGPRPVDLTFRAEGGQEAVAADARGETQRVRISARLAQWVNEEFIGPAPGLLVAAAR